MNIVNVKTRLIEMGKKQKDLAAALFPDSKEQYAAHRTSLLMNGHREVTIKEAKLIKEFTGLNLDDIL